MSARILVVDDLAPNRKLLEVKLAQEFYDVVCAASGEEALQAAAVAKMDLILMDAMMPGMDGFEACRRFKADPATWHIPIAMVTALEETRDRIRGLEAGADDFITKPIDDFNLVARVRSLLRLKMVTDQLLSHTAHDPDAARPTIDRIDRRPGRILVVDPDRQAASRVSDALSGHHDVVFEPDMRRAMELARAPLDLVIVTLGAHDQGGLRLVANLRHDLETKDIPILAVSDAHNEADLVRAYDLGVTDTVMRPVDNQELLARVGAQLRRKFYADALRDNFNENLEMVVTDSLTGLGNRRHFDRAVQPLLEAADAKNLSILVLDIDHFKRVNDILGHDMGDTVLKEVAARMASNLRAVDIVARYGGEEFMVALPGAALPEAEQAAERLRRSIGTSPIILDGQALRVTASVGVAQVREGERLRDIFKRADAALYRAKHAGRDRVEKAA